MSEIPTFVDIHCHLVPGIDDGPKSWDQSLAMAEMAVADGIRQIIVTPHQLGNFCHNGGDLVRTRTDELQVELESHGIGLRVLPGADVRIQPDMIELIQRGEVVTLADQRKHVLLELPHELYFPIDEVLGQLSAEGMTGILSHPERNQGLLKHPENVEALVDAGCLMQITCGSLMGTFGPGPQQMAEHLIRHGLVHFLATDAHGPRSRRPLMRRAFERTRELAGDEMAVDLCCRNPAAIVTGESVDVDRHRVHAHRSVWSRIFKRRDAA